MDWIISALTSIPNKELSVFIISMIPVLELRAAIPIGVGMGLPWYISFLLSVAGNCLPIPFIIYLVRPLFGFLRETKLFNKVVDWLEHRTEKKSASLVKYSAWGLFIFVAIPLPGTGAWTGAMIAGLLDMREKYALPAIFGGVIVAGILTLGITMGFNHLFF